MGATAPAPPSKDGPEEASAAKSGRCCQPQAPPEAVRVEIRSRCQARVDRGVLSPQRASSVEAAERHFMTSGSRGDPDATGDGYGWRGTPCEERHAAVVTAPWSR